MMTRSSYGSGIGKIIQMRPQFKNQFPRASLCEFMFARPLLQAVQLNTRNAGQRQEALDGNSPLVVLLKVRAA